MRQQRIIGVINLTAFLRTAVGKREWGLVGGNPARPVRRSLEIQIVVDEDAAASNIIAVMADIVLGRAKKIVSARE